MPIDPNIALGVKPLQLADPLAQYGRIAAIQNAQTQNQLAQFQISAAQRADAQAEARLNALRQAGNDPVKITNALISAGDVKGAAEYSKMFREGRKADAELLDTKLKTARQFLTGINPADPNAPAQYMQWHMANHADPVIGPALAARGITAEQSLDRIKQAMQTPGGLRTLLQQSALGMDKFIELNKPTPVQADLGGRVMTVTRPGLEESVMSFTKEQLPPEVEAQKARLARAGAPSISFSTEKKYADVVAGGGGADDLALYNAASSAPEQVVKLDETLNLLKTQDVNTGIGAALFTALDKARGQFLADKAAGKRVTSTEYLDALLGSDVFPQIQALGIGARGLDTPAEREYLRKVMTGTIELNKDTLIKMAEFRRRGLETTVSKYNKLVNSGQLDKFFEARGRVKETFELPKAETSAPTVAQIPTGRGPATPAPQLAPIDQQALEWANANPADPRAAAIKQRLGR